MSLGNEIVQALTSGTRLRRHTVKNLFLRPLDANSLTIPPVSNETVRRCVLSIIDIFKQMHANDFQAAFQSAVAAVGALGSAARQESVSTHNAIALLLGVVNLAKKIDVTISKQTLLDALRLEYSHLRRDAREDSDKRAGMALCLVEIIKLCIDDQVPGIVDSLLASSQGILETENLPKSVAVTLKFFIAKHLLFLDDFETARRELLIARSSMQMKSQSQLEQVLSLLIPLQLSNSLFPTLTFLNQFPRLKSAFFPLLKAVRKGDLFQTRKCMRDLKMEEVFFVLTRRIELVVYRTIVKKVFETNPGKRRIDFEILNSVFEFSAQKSVSSACVEEIVANLVFHGFMTGYLSYEEQALMLTGANPFPLAL